MTTVIGVILSVPTLTRNLFEWPAHNLQKSQPTGLSSLLVCIHSQNAVTYSSVSHTYYQILMILSVWAGWWGAFFFPLLLSKSYTVHEFSHSLSLIIQFFLSFSTFPEMYDCTSSSP